MSLNAIEAAEQTRMEPLASPPEYLSWGRHPRVEHKAVYKIYWPEQVKPILAQSVAGEYLAYGLGRSYGDSCLNEGRSLLDCSRLDRILFFDKQTGCMGCEAGVTLGDIVKIAAPAGWFLPVTPGTKFVTVGGAIANDVHGKNHHRYGTFGLHVKRILLCRSDAGLLECSLDDNEELFRATVGGLGLTGVILAAELTLKQIPGTRVDSESIPFESIAEFQALSTESDEKFEYTVAWIDSFSNKQLLGIFFRGNHGASAGDRRESRPGVRIPCSLPRFFLNKRGLKLFNSGYYHWKTLRKSQTSASIDSFFYPLDSIRGWNLLYGKAGLVQYQCVVPESACAAIEEMLARTANEGLGSFLTVLKRFGELDSPGMLSFPRPGLTLTLDFPMRGERTLRLLDLLDEIVRQSGGALYPAKDARMSRRVFESSFPRLHEFQRLVDPAMSSSLWRRVTQG